MTRVVQGVVPPANRPRPTATDDEPPIARSTVPDQALGSDRPTGPEAPSGTTTIRAATLTTSRPGASHDDRIGTQLQGFQDLDAPRPEAPKLRLVAGKVVPGTRYRIVRWLGEGGMGVVYEAEHVDIERRVALKILRFDLSRQPRMVQVFKDEARAASRLGSQYVVEIYDFGELADGRMFFAMELLDGHDLVPPQQGEGMEPGRLVGILRQLAKGLGRAHAAGVVHRDVKPENLITATAIDGRESVKMVDFGISAMLAEGRDGSGIAGTPHYMAPEQILGRAFDGRLDIYALGCTAYELLVGQPPFDADNVPALLRMHLEVAPEWPSARFPDRTLPPALEAAIMRCLEKDPDARYPNMAEFEAALCEAQIADRLVTPWDDLPLPDIADLDRRERIRRNMPTAIVIRERRGWVWPLVAGLSTFAAAGLGLFLAFGRGPTVEEQDAVEVLTNEARTAAAKAHWVMPPRDDPGAPTAIRKVQDIEALEGAAEDFADARGEALRREFAETLVRHGNELWDYGAISLAAVRYLDALVFDETNTLAATRLATNVPAAVIVDYIERARRGELTEVEHALSLIAAAEMSDNPDEREALADEAEAVMARGTMSDATKMLLAETETKSKVMQQRRSRRREVENEPPVRVAVAAPPPVAAAATVPLPVATEAAAAEPTPAAPAPGGSAFAAKPAATSSKAATNRAREEAGIGKGTRDPERAKELTEQAHAEAKAGRRHAAETLFNQALSADPRHVDALIGLSDVYFDTGETHKAVNFAERAVEVAPKNARLRLKLGDCYFKVLRYPDALEQYEKAKDLGSTNADERIQKVKAKLGH